MTENPTSNRKAPSQKRAQTTVKKVLDGTWQLLKEQGADAITTRNISKITGVSPGSIYQYFGNKEQILFTLYGERLKDSVGAFKLASTDENFSLSLAAFYQILGQELSKVGWGRVEDVELTKAIAENPQLKDAVEPILNELYDCLIYILRRYGSTWSEDDLKHLAEYIFGVNHFGYSLRIRQSEPSATKTIGLTRELEYYLINKAVNDNSQ